MQKLSAIPAKPKSVRGNILTLLNGGKGTNGAVSTEKGNAQETQFADLIYKLMHFEPSRRTSAAELLRDPFMVSTAL